ncbi:MAG: glycosyltransferase family 2 protein [Pyrinomonadaceae bacterium]
MLVSQKNNLVVTDVGKTRNCDNFKRRVFTRNDSLIFALLTVFSYTVYVYVLKPWFASDEWFTNPFAFWILTIIFFSRLLISQFRWWVLPFMKKPIQIPARPGLKVGVATTFVPEAEPIQMLEETVAAMVAMDYPHDTWVLDEGDDIEVRGLCEKLGALHFSRKNLAHYQTNEGTFQARTKHGNYNSWLQEIGYQKYEIITAFDPDHIPESNFLSEVLGYFDAPEIGYVQAAQVYYNQRASFIARGAAEETYSYYSSVQMCCYSMGYPIVTGCHNTHRAAALEQVGGFAAHDADDLLITLLYRSSGWSGVYVPKILAKGLTPVDWNGYLKQQLRWARSVLDIKFRIHPKLFGKLSFKELVTSILHGFYYLQGATNFIVLLLVAYMLAAGFVPRTVNYFVSLNFVLLTTVLVICEFFRQRFYLDRRNEWGFHWRAGFLQLAKSPYLLIALYQVVTNRKFEYVVTDKVRKKANNYKLFLPHLLGAALILAAWIFGIIYHQSLHPSLHFIAGVVIIGTLIMVGTGFMMFPDPYDSSLRISSGEYKENRITE